MIRNTDEEYPTSHPKESSILERKAARHGWNIPDEYKDAIVQGQVKIAVSPTSSPREKTSAARCLTSMNGQNIAVDVSGLEPTAKQTVERVNPLDLLVAMRRATAPGPPDAD